MTGTLLAIAMLLIPLQSAHSVQTADPLSSLISGKTFERGRKESTGKYELYKYDGYRSEGCNIQWNETHQVFQNGKQTFLTVQTVSVQLGTIDPTSLSTSRYETGFLVSLNTLGLEPLIKAKVKTTYEDLTEDNSIGLTSGYGFYLSSNVEATKLFAELKKRTKLCKS